MAKRYEFSDDAWVVVSNLFIETHGRGRPLRSNRLMLDGVLWVALLWCCLARYAGSIWPMINGASTISGLAKPGDVHQMHKRLHLRLNEQGLIDPQTWMINQPQYVQPEPHLAPGKKCGPTSLPITL